MPNQSTMPWLSIAPVAASRSSYNGLLVALFILMSATMASTVIHRFASAALRRAPGLGLRLSRRRAVDPVQRRKFQSPVRRVFGRIAFAMEERIDMPAPGETRAAHST